uniref:Uncharacterized protein n=1 Tax=Manihot esculenta TaxID=3983 RepID=A0A2C9U4D0_MANES
MTRNKCRLFINQSRCRQIIAQEKDLLLELQSVHVHNYQIGRFISLLGKRGWNLSLHLDMRQENVNLKRIMFLIWHFNSNNCIWKLAVYCCIFFFFVCISCACWPPTELCSS